MGEAADDVDWQGEARWYDRSWIGVAVAFLFTAGIVAVLLLVWGDADIAIGGAISGAGACVVVLVATWNTRRQIANESGLSRRQIPVVARRLRKERLPADPQARLAMTVLAQRQLGQRGGRWWLLILGGVDVLLGGGALATGDRSFGMFWLGLAALQVLIFFVQRRTFHRLERALTHLIPATPPTHHRPA